MRELEPEVANAVWEALEALIPSREANHTKLPTPLGMRWTVERTNSWLSNYGQLRRNTG